MYCSNCGFNNKENVKFCENCGKPTTNPITPVSPKSSWRMWASIGAALVVICFFLSWVGVGNQIFSYSGFEIATKSYSFGINVLILFLLPLIGVLTLIAINGKMGGSLIPIIGGGLGCLGLILLMSYLKVVDIRLYGIGIWGQWLGNLIQIATGFLSLNK